MTAEEIFKEFAEKSRELTDRSIADLYAKIDAAVASPRIIRMGHYVGELSPDGREIALAHGVVVVPPNAIVTTATPEEARNFVEFREETRAALARWYDQRPNVCD